MSKITWPVRQKILNYITTIVAILSYIILKIYNSSQNLQTIQKVFLVLIFLCGLIFIINNLKGNNGTFLKILFVCIGALLVVYSGFILYLIFALQNVGF